jgi:UPF0042 nucleotide-binding protein
MKLILVTGMSGSGKSVALKTLEDCGFEAIDNMPLALLPTVAATQEKPRNLAIGIDVRSRDFSVAHFKETLASLKAAASEFQLLFLDCDDEVLRRRFTETRRRHPLALDRPVPDGIKQERESLEGLRDEADLVIDTSDLTSNELKRFITAHFTAGEEQQIALTVLSFSFKRGLPREADNVIDVRFLKNPHYDPALRQLSGRDKPVGQHIESDHDFASFYEGLCTLVSPLLPRYVAEGKHYLTIAIGCTGGQHRSVYVAEKLSAFLRAQGYNVTTRHRDLVEISPVPALKKTKKEKL